MLSMLTVNIEILPWSKVLCTTEALLVIYTCWKLIVYPEYFSPLRNIPGPPADSWLFGSQIRALREEPGFWHVKWFRKYGPVYRYRAFGGDDYLCISDPKAIQYILLQNANAFPKPVEDIKSLERVTGRGLVTVEGEDHRRQRKIMGVCFTQLQTNTYYPVFQEQAHKLVRLFGNVADQQEGSDAKQQGVVVNMCNWLSRTTLDIISLAGFDYAVGALDDEKHPLILVFNLMLRPFDMTASLMLLIRCLNKIPHLDKLPVPLLKAAKESMALMRQEAKNMLGRKLDMLETGELDDKKDILSIMIKASKKAASPKEMLKEEEFDGSVSTLLVAGHETSSTALTWILYELSRRPEIQTKLRREVQEAYKQSSLGEEVGLTQEELTDLPYLDAVVRETLRLVPPVPGNVRAPTADEMVPLGEPIRARDGSLISELFVPKNQIILFDILELNTSKELFGQDANEYRPERWLDDEGRLQKQSRAYVAWAPIMSFLGGARGCIGYRFAILEIKTILAALLNKLEFSETGDKISKRLNIIQRPVVIGRINEGAQLPLKIKRASELRP